MALRGTLGGALDTAALMRLVSAPHPRNNVPSVVKAKLGAGLHRKPFHPINTLKTKIGGRQ